MATESNPFGEVTRLMQQFKVPGLDMVPNIESRRKDREAIVGANKATYEAMQALVRKQAEILTQTMQGIQDSAKSLLTGGADAMDPAKQAELVRSAYQKALTDMKDLAAMTRKSQDDVMAVITKRATESVQEIQKLVHPK